MLIKYENIYTTLKKIYIYICIICKMECHKSDIRCNMIRVFKEKSNVWIIILVTVSNQLHWKMNCTVYLENHQKTAFLPYKGKELFKLYNSTMYLKVMHTLNTKCGNDTQMREKAGWEILR
jgi:hypothetical protein